MIFCGGSYSSSCGVTVLIYRKRQPLLKAENFHFLCCFLQPFLDYFFSLTWRTTSVLLITFQFWLRPANSSTGTDLDWNYSSVWTTYPRLPKFSDWIEEWSDFVSLRRPMSQTSTKISKPSSFLTAYVSGFKFFSSPLVISVQFCNRVNPTMYDYSEQLRRRS
jgi:hypothetical protein